METSTCWKRAGRDAGSRHSCFFLNLLSKVCPKKKVCPVEPCGPRKAWSQVPPTGGEPGAKSRRPTWGLPRALTLESRST